jgi:type IV pilus assembly protein PilW
MIYAQITQPGAHRQRGFSLVELMVAITIGIILLAGVLQIYLSSKQSYRVQEATSRLQENGRFAIELLGRDIRDAGNFGCRARAASKPVEEGGVLTVNHLNPAGTGYLQYNANLAVTGVEGAVANVTPDSITLQSTVDGGIKVLNAGPQTSANIQVVSPNTLASGNIVLVTDCENGDVFQISGGNPGASGTVVHNTGAGSPGNIQAVTCTGANAHCLSKVYGTDARIFTTRQLTYTIAPGASGQNALFLSVNGAPPQELVEGVENMQILYGVDGPDADFSAEQYLTAAQVGANFNQVVSVQISLLLVSAGDTGANVVTAPQTYTFPLGAASATTAADRRLRRVFTSTFSVRNRTS